jgi:RNA polymerase sigma factor (sigma-70 family)
MDKQQLIEGCCKQDIRSQKALYDWLHPQMLGVCMRYASDRDQAQDMLQEGFIKVYNKIDTYKGVGAFEGWVRRVVVNSALEFLRSQKNNSNVSFEDESIMVVDHRANAQDELQAQDILKTIQSLPTGYRMVFNLFAIEGYSHEEIAKELGISVNTSYSQYHRAKALLQKIIESEKKTVVKTAV